MGGGQGWMDVRASSLERRVRNSQLSKRASGIRLCPVRPARHRASEVFVGHAQVQEKKGGLVNTKDLFGPVEFTEFPVPPTSTYSDAAILTACHVLADMTGGADAQKVGTIKDELSPWVPVDQREGRMSKRMSSYLFSKFGVKADQGEIASLGNYLASDIPSDSVRFDITKDLVRWRMGEFGDRKSCFEGKSSTLHAMQKAGGAGFRLYTANKDGSGRAWVLPYKERPVLINAYGPTLDGFKARLRILLPEAQLATVTTRNNGSDVGPLWVN